MIILRICLDIDIEGAEIELDSIQISLGAEIGHNTNSVVSMCIELDVQIWEGCRCEAEGVPDVWKKWWRSIGA